MGKSPKGPGGDTPNDGGFGGSGGRKGRGGGPGGDSVREQHEFAKQNAEKGRAPDWKPENTQPPERAPDHTPAWEDPAGGTVTYGKNEMSHLRSHAQDIRLAAREEGIEIPRSPSRPETRQAMRDYIESIVQNPDRAGVGDYKTHSNAIWSARGDLIIIRTRDGEFITALRESGGRAATNAPWKKGEQTDGGE